MNRVLNNGDAPVNHPEFNFIHFFILLHLYEVGSKSLLTLLMETP